MHLKEKKCVSVTRLNGFSETNMTCNEVVMAVYCPQEGGWGPAMVLGNFQCWGILLIWRITSGC